MTQKRNRRTREEMLAHHRAQAEKLEAQIAGSYKDESENAVLKQLKARLRKTNTELKGAGVILNGVTREDGKGWTRAPIEQKIEGTIARLATQRETMARAEEYSASLPFDVDRLEALIAAAEAGEEVEFPKDLTRLPCDEDRTDEEHEAAFIAGESEEN